MSLATTAPQEGPTGGKTIFWLGIIALILVGTSLLMVMRKYSADVTPNNNGISAGIRGQASPEGEKTVLRPESPAQ